MSLGITPFHLAFPVKDFESTRLFYGNVLKCREGRSTENWIDWDLYGHQLSTHLKPSECKVYSSSSVDSQNVPCLHFGAILYMEQWEELKERIIKQDVMDKINFIVEPQIRFKGQAGEQATMFFLDPSGNALEFKAFHDMKQIFDAA